MSRAARVWLRIQPLSWLVFTIFCIASQSQVAAAASSVTCTSLEATLSPDKNYYVFTAAASGDSNAIIGYTFTFGDHQTYTVTFGASSSQDRHGATVTHSYQGTGNYTPSVRVNTAVNGKRTSVSSASCRTTVSIGSSGSTLPDTGAGDTLALFAVACLLGTYVHHRWLRRRRETYRDL